VLAGSNHHLLLPGGTTDDQARTLLRATYPSDDGDACVCQLPHNGLTMAWTLPRGMQAFLGRTFNYPAVYHPLYPLCEHCRTVAGGTTRMVLNLHERSMDMVIHDREGNLLTANSYAFNHAEDAAYLALHAWRTHGMDQLADELQLMGDGAPRAAITPLLRKYVKYVMPAIYPAAALRLGRNAMQAPLELILLALLLCES